MAVCKVPPYEMIAMVRMSTHSTSGLQLESPSGEFRIATSHESAGPSTLVVHHKGQTHTFTGDDGIQVFLEAGEMTVMASPLRETPA